MRLAISNIAWDTVEDEAVFKLLHHFSVDAIDVAAGKYFPELTEATDADIAKVKHWWEERGIAITGMQALLFGTTGLNVFGSTESQQAMLRHLTAVCRIASGLGATRLVFGSPKNRDRGHLTDQETMDIAVPFFQQLGDIAQNYGVLMCLEPNPPCYGANFMINSVETAQVVQVINHPAIKMQLDTGAITINGEDAAEILQDYAPLIGHIHASEPNLLPLGDGSTDHAKIATALTQQLPNHIVSIEMLTNNKNEPCLISIERALTVAVRHYRHKEML